MNIFIKNNDGISVFDVIQKKYCNNSEIFNKFIDLVVSNYIYSINNNKNKIFVDNIDINCRDKILNYDKCYKLIKNKILLEKVSFPLKKKSYSITVFNDNVQNEMLNFIGISLD